MRQLNRADAAFADTIFPFENELQQWPPGIGITSSRFFEFGDVQIMSCRHSIAIRHLTHRLSPAPRRVGDTVSSQVVMAAAGIG